MMRTSGSFAGKRVDRENECCYNNKAIYEPLAQSVEHLTFNQGVRGSNPRWVISKAPEIIEVSGVFLSHNIFSLRFRATLYPLQAKELAEKLPSVSSFAFHFIAARVLTPTIPSTTSPAAFWNPLAVRPQIIPAPEVLHRLGIRIDLFLLPCARPESFASYAQPGSLYQCCHGRFFSSVSAIRPLAGSPAMSLTAFRIRL